MRWPNTVDHGLCPMNCVHHPESPRPGIFGRALALAALLLPSLAVAQAKPPMPATFESHVLPIFTAHCAECHGPQDPSGSLHLLTRDDVVRGGQSGPAIRAGNARLSLLVRQLEQGKMPPEGPALKPEQLATIRRWIQSGGRRDGESAKTTRRRIAALTISEQTIFTNVFFTNCLDCHGKWRKEGGLDLRTRAGLLKGGKSGPGIVPGDPESSLVYRKILANKMPPPKNLFGDQTYVTRVRLQDRNELRDWIAAGALPSRKTRPQKDPVLNKKRLDHWAFRPPRRPRVPKVKHGDLLNNPIDAFLLARLEPKQLRFSPAADPIVLLRRASLMLTGLPPGPHETSALLDGQKPHSFEAFLDRLLASPHYAEHQATWWLDGAGYADTHGQINRDELKPFMWRYRDYVIRAFREDKPYDRFLTEQLAGDELFAWKDGERLTAEQLQSLIATGFLRTASDATDEGSFNKVLNRFGVINEQIDIITSSVMGMTLECARCHSHKFDPVPQEDYYRFAAIFRPALDPYDWRIPNVVLHPPKYPVPNKYSRDLFQTSDRPNAVIQLHNEQLETRARKLATQISDRARQLKDKDLNTDKLAASLRADIKTLRSRKIQSLRIHGLADTGGVPTPVYVFRRGEIHQPGGEVTPGPPVALSTDLEPYRVVAPKFGKTSGRRLALARWLTQPDHPLTARVIVNRIWQQHFGRGLVNTPGNFGRIGAKPTHPRLLDWLSTEFVQNGWSIRRLHKQIMMSSAWQQSSRTRELHNTDPDNRLLSRFPFRRLAAEAIRDSILAISGGLDRRLLGPPTERLVEPTGEVRHPPGPQGHRRSIYLVRRRKTPNTMLDLFDAPAMSPNCLQRTDSTVPTQALELFNSEFVRNAAARFSRRLLKTGRNSPRLLVTAYRLAFGRNPTSAELRRDRIAINELTRRWETELQGDDSPETAEQRALQNYCLILLNSPELVYVD